MLPDATIFWNCNTAGVLPVVLAARRMKNYEWEL